MPDDAAVKQLQADVARIDEHVTNIRQIVALWPAAFGGLEDKVDAVREQAKVIIDQNDKLVDLIANPSDPDAGIAALAGISKLVTLHEVHASRLTALEATAAHIEAATAAIASGLDAHRTETGGNVGQIITLIHEARRADLARDWSVRSGLRWLGAGVGVVILVLFIIMYIMSGLIQRFSIAIYHALV